MENTEIVATTEEEKEALDLASTNFTDFFPDQVKVLEDKEVHLKRFKKPFILRAVTSEESEILQKQATKTVAGVKGRQERKLDTSAFNTLFVLAAIVYPDLQNTELQKAWGVTGDKALLDAMVNSGEYIALLEEATELSGFGTSLREDADKVKN